jgi:glycosyltransferase involved in cell wall biosynthesis
VISAVGVVVPAHNEAGRVGACLESIKVALAALPSNVDSAIWVMVDRSTDGTLRIVEASLAGRPRWGWESSGQERAVGWLRHRGARAALNLLRPHPARSTWLLHTDADSKVPSDWVVRHLRHAEDGAHAVAGVVRLDDLGHLHPRAAHRYEVLVNAERGDLGHSQVYGANLGVRGDAYLAVNGFRARATSEDADLVKRLERSGFRVAHALDVSVSTSARLEGRANGGLADLLGQLQSEATGRDARA